MQGHPNGTLPGAPTSQLALLREVMAEDCLTLTMAQVAQLLGINVDSAYDYAHQEKFPVLKLGRRLFVPKVPFLRLLGVEPADLRHLIAAVDGLGGGGRG